MKCLSTIPPLAKIFPHPEILRETPAGHWVKKYLKNIKVYKIAGGFILGFNPIKFSKKN